MKKISNILDMEDLLNAMLFLVLIGFVLGSLKLTGII